MKPRSISGKKLCSSCGLPLGKGAAMIIETLHLYFHIQCFRVRTPALLSEGCVLASSSILLYWEISSWNSRRASAREARRSGLYGSVCRALPSGRNSPLTRPSGTAGEKKQNGFAQRVWNVASFPLLTLLWLHSKGFYLWMEDFPSVKWLAASCFLVGLCMPLCVITDWVSLPLRSCPDPQTTSVPLQSLERAFPAPYHSLVSLLNHHLLEYTVPSIRAGAVSVQLTVISSEPSRNEGIDQFTENAEASLLVPHLLLIRGEVNQ